MSYPTRFGTPEATQRNLAPITEALSSVLDGAGISAGEASSGSVDDASTTRRKRRVLEIGSGSCVHMKHWAGRWGDVEWWPTGRDEGQVRTIDEALDSERTGGRLQNVRNGLELDIGSEQAWERWEGEVRRAASGGLGGTDPQEALFEGLIMVNVVHCCPVEYPENVFRHLSPSATKSDTAPLLDPSNGWIAIYSPFRADDGSYKSEADEKFDKGYIKAGSDLLGLRTVPCLTQMAERWGFGLVERRDMPAGNLFLVYRPMSKG